MALLQKWNKAINLVGKSTEHDIWHRHIADSLQLLPLLPGNTPTLADFGSGAGLPGIVIAMARPAMAVTLIEQDQRKAAFLQEVIGVLSLKNTRIMNIDIHKVAEKFTAITARALAPLGDLCALAYPRMEARAFCLFPKGKNFANELAAAKANWTFDHRLTPSKTMDDSVVVTITDLSPRAAT